MSDFDQKAYKKAYYAAHKEELKEKAKRWYRENRALCIERSSSRNATEEGKARRRAYYHKDPNHYIQKTRAWREANPEKFKLNSTRYVHARRARLVAAKGFFSPADWLLKVALYGWRCVYCKKSLTEKTLTLDHKIPLSKGGTNWLANLAPACGPCNSRKADKLEIVGL